MYKHFQTIQFLEINIYLSYWTVTKSELKHTGDIRTHYTLLLPQAKV